MRQHGLAGNRLATGELEHATTKQGLDVQPNACRVAAVDQAQHRSRAEVQLQRIAVHGAAELLSTVDHARAEDVVVDALAIKYVAGRAGCQQIGVVSCSAIQVVCQSSRLECVVAAATAQLVIGAAATVQCVVASLAVEHVIACAAVQIVQAIPAIQRVVVGAPHQYIVTALAIQPVIATFSEQHIVADAAPGMVVAEPPRRPAGTACPTPARNTGHWADPPPSS